MTQESLEHKCCIQGCNETPTSVMKATKDGKTLCFYACEPHEPALWKHTIRKYSNAGYEMKIMNIAVEEKL